MQVQNIECQLAQVQLKRYLNGEELPAELLTDLETHLEECRDCREAAKQRSVAAPKSAPKLDLKALVSPRPATAAVDRPSLKNSKTILLSAGLAVVLIAMSTILRDPTKFLGAKADESVKAAATADSGEPKLSEPQAVPDEEGATDLSGLALSATGLQGEGSEPTPAADLDPEPEGATASLPESEPTGETEPKGPAATPTTTGDGLSIPGKPTLQGQDVVVVGGSEPKPPVSTTKPKTTQARRPVRRAPAKKPAAKPAASGIRVYDSTGKRIK